MNFSNVLQLVFLLCAIGLGCGGDQPVKATTVRKQPSAIPSAPQDDKAEPDKIKKADVSVLYFGNSHTGHHDIPDLVGRMIQFGRPSTSYASQQIGCAFLEDAANN